MPLEDARGRVDAAPTVGTISHFQAAGFWIRLLAFIADSVVTTLLFMLGVILYMFYVTATSGLDALDSMEFDSIENVSVLISLAYFTLAVGCYATTAGKRLFGLYVIRTGGAKVGIGRALVRFLMAGISALVFGIGFLMIAFRDDKRGLHDLICDTVVIRRRGPGT